MELLSWKSLNDLSGDGGVRKTELEAGSGWETPKEDDEVAGALPRARQPPAALAVLSQLLHRVRPIDPDDFSHQASPNVRRGAHARQSLTLCVQSCRVRYLSIKCLCSLPERTCVCAVKYAVYLRGQSSPVAESPADGEVFTLKAGGSFPALALAAKDMKLGAKLRLDVSPKCALPAPPAIPLYPQGRTLIAPRARRPATGLRVHLAGSGRCRPSAQARLRLPPCPAPVTQAPALGTPP